MSVRLEHAVGIRDDDGNWRWFDTQEECNRVWQEMIIGGERAAADAEARKRASIAAEVAERAAMWGMEP